MPESVVKIRLRPVGGLTNVIFRVNTPDVPHAWPPLPTLRPDSSLSLDPRLTGGESADSRVAQRDSPLPAQSPSRRGIQTAGNAVRQGRRVDPIPCIRGGEAEEEEERKPPTDA